MLLDEVGAVLTLTDEGTAWLNQRLAHELNETRRNHEVLVRLDAITATLTAATTLPEAAGLVENGAVGGAAHQWYFCELVQLRRVRQRTSPLQKNNYSSLNVYGPSEHQSSIT